MIASSYLQISLLIQKFLSRRYFMLGLTFLFTFLSFIACKQPKENPEIQKGQITLELMKLDERFSDSCIKLGKTEAFLKFLDSSAILLRPDAYPIDGTATTDYLVEQQNDDIDYSLLPKQADVSASGDLGFTYGVYKIRPKDYDTAFYGTYTNIWKKQPDGNWKLILNSENTGVGE